MLVWRAAWLAVVALAVVNRAPGECYVAIVAVTTSISITGATADGRNDVER